MFYKWTSSTIPSTSTRITYASENCLFYFHFSRKKCFRIMLFIGYSNHLYASALPYELFYCHIYIKVLIWLQNTYSSTMQCTYVLIHVCIQNTFLLSTYILQIGKLFGSKWSWCRYLGIYVFLTKCITQELQESSNKRSYTTYILYLPTICNLPIPTVHASKGNVCKEGN